MPYDGTPQAQTDLIRLIDDMLEIFGPNGEYWLQRRMYSLDGSACMLGALYVSRGRLKLRGSEFKSYFDRALRRVGLNDHWGIMGFNDDVDVDFQHIRGLLLLMRQIAEGADPGRLYKRTGGPVDVLLEGFRLLEDFSRDSEQSLAASREAPATRRTDHVLAVLSGDS